MSEELEGFFDLEDDDVPIRWFDAAYESECPGCGATIFPGDRAGYVGHDDQASCAGCCLQAS